MEGKVKSNDLSTTHESDREKRQISNERKHSKGSDFALKNIRKQPRIEKN